MKCCVEVEGSNGLLQKQLRQKNESRGFHAWVVRGRCKIFSMVCFVFCSVTFGLVLLTLARVLIQNPPISFQSKCNSE